MKGCNYIKCNCGGIIGMYNGNTFNCERCGKEFQIYDLSYDVCFSNNKTGWLFPMKRKNVGMNKTYKIVEQICESCGKHFYLNYCSDGTYRYVEGTCDCEADFHPVDGEPTISEWIKTLK